MNEQIRQLYKHYKENPFISTDSRKITTGSLFFAIKGDHFNGNDYAVDALHRGASLAVIDENIDVQDDRLYRVDDVIKTLQELAKHHRQTLGLTILAITGSNGKTTTKEIIQKVLAKKFNSLATQGNLNNHIGVPLTLLSLAPEHEIGIIEMGANHPNEIHDLCDIAQPNFGLITNVGKAHLEGFGSFENIVNAKTEMYRYLREHDGEIFLNSGNEHLRKAASGIKSFTYGIDDAQVLGNIISTDPYLTISYRINNLSYIINTRLFGKYNFENVLAAVAVGTYFKVLPEDLIDAVESYEPSNNRSQVIKTSSNTLIMDAYNANPTSMKASIENFAESDFKNKVAIMGDMAELGNESEKEHLAVLELLQKADLNRVIVVGPIFHGLKNKEIISFSTIESLSKYIRVHPLSDSTVLLKGSRIMQLEKLLSLL